MAHPGTAHVYSKKLVAFEHAPSHAAPNTLLWIGGLGDGLLTVSYPRAIAAALPPDWTLAEVVIRSSYNGWGTGSLARDARELDTCVKYFRELKPGKEGKVVLMGHSTGCQDIMEYLVGPQARNRLPIDGAILQGGVSDREALDDVEDIEEEELAMALKRAKDMIDQGDSDEIVPLRENVVAREFEAPMTAYRTYSLLAKGGDDDYFSSDLTDEHFSNSFGKIPASTPLCFLLGEKDPYVPPTIDRAALLQRWTRLVREGGGVVDSAHGGVVRSASHNLNGNPEEVVNDLVKRVVGFLEGLEKESESSADGSRL
jgi:hypothetical protein